MGVDFSNVTLPFSAGDLLQSGLSLMKVFGPFILLGLAIMFTPKLIGLVRTAAQSRSKNN